MKRSVLTRYRAMAYLTAVMLLVLCTCMVFKYGFGMGKDLTLVTMGSMVPLCLQAAETLAQSTMSVEVLDLRCLMPLDVESIIASVRKTGRLVVAEPGWRMFGAGAEIVAMVAETLGKDIRSRPRRVTWPQSAVPTGSKLEEQFYPTSEDIVAACRASITEELSEE